MLQGVCPCLHPTTVLGHVVVLRLSPLRNEVEKSFRIAGMPHPGIPIGVTLPIS